MRSEADSTNELIIAGACWFTGRLNSAIKLESGFSKFNNSQIVVVLPARTELA